MSIHRQMTAHEIEVFEETLAAMSKFWQTFGRNVKPAFIAELHVARQLGLALAEGVNQPGYDAIGTDGKRYQIKNRAAQTQNVDVNNFDFDYIVLVNLDDAYQVAGMWQLPATVARQIFVQRKKFRKYQVTQKRFKQNARRIV